MHNYKPINCSFYDFIEHYAVLGEKVRIEYRDENHNPHVTEAIIKDTLILNSVEFMVLETGQQIRMDHIICINDHRLPN